MGINIFAEVYRKCKRTREKVIDGVLTLIRLDRYVCIQIKLFITFQL